MSRHTYIVTLQVVVTSDGNLSTSDENTIASNVQKAVQHAHREGLLYDGVEAWTQDTYSSQWYSISKPFASINEVDLEVGI